MDTTDLAMAPLKRKAEKDLKLVTFNIRCDYDQDGENSFRFRMPLILKKIAEEDPDILCFQEVLPHVATWLKEVLSGYYLIGCGRSGELLDEQLSIAFKKEKFNLIAMDSFWLSETPFIPGSRYKVQSICPRTCTEALLEYLPEKKVLRLLNTHLDHEGVEARRLGLSQIIKKCEEARLFPEAPVVLVGDFNAKPDSEEIREIREHSGFFNVTEGIGTTFHDFKGGENGETIDYIYLDNRRKEEGVLIPVKVEKWTDCERGVYLSDHYPVAAVFAWKEK